MGHETQCERNSVSNSSMREPPYGLELYYEFGPRWRRELMRRRDSQSQLHPDGFSLRLMSQTLEDLVCG